MKKPLRAISLSLSRQGRVVSREGSATLLFDVAGAHLTRAGESSGEKAAARGETGVRAVGIRAPLSPLGAAIPKLDSPSWVRCVNRASKRRVAQRSGLGART